MGRINILLVEDEATDAELTMRVLRQHHSVGWIHRVSDGQLALDYLFRENDYADCTDPLPRIVVLDLQLPRLSGLQVMQAIRQDPRTVRLPVLILTESHFFQDIQSTYRFAAASYLPKPISLQFFGKVLDELGL